MANGEVVNTSRILTWFKVVGVSDCEGVEDEPARVNDRTMEQALNSAQ